MFPEDVPLNTLDRKAFISSPYPVAYFARLSSVFCVRLAIETVLNTDTIGLFSTDANS